MATPKGTTKKPAAKPSASKAIVAWDEELAKQAEVAAGMEANTGGGQFFSLKAGVLSFDGAPMPGNQMCVIILDSVFETTYYEGEYDPDSPASPTAFAFGRDEDTMVWHENSAPEFAGLLCRESEVCQWGSSDKGRGKAAKENRRLAMIPAGVFNRQGDLELFDDEAHFSKAEIAFMKVPVTSVKGYAAFVKQTAAQLKRPPHGIFARVWVEPDPKSQFKVYFEAIEKVPNELMQVIMDRNEEAKASIEFPYQPYEAPAPKAPPRSRAAQKPAAGKAGAKTGGRKY